MSKCEDNPKRPSAAVWSALTSRHVPTKVAAALLFLIYFAKGAGGGYWGNANGGISGSETGTYSVTVPRSTDLCPSMVRAGDKGDGGWWTCGESTLVSAKSEACIVYSFGIRDNFSFDHFVVERGCDVHGFDPSPAGLESREMYEKINNDKGKGVATYHSYGLGSVDKNYGPGEVPFRWPGLGYLAETNTLPWELLRLPTIMSKLDTKSGLTILKVDIEGGEWDVMHDIVEADWDELYIELHFPPGEYKLSKSSDGKGMEVVKTRRAGGSLQSKKARNVSGPIDRIGLIKMLMQVSDMFYWEPNGSYCVEIYFRRKKGSTFSTTAPRPPSPGDEVD